MNSISTLNYSLKCGGIFWPNRGEILDRLAPLLTQLEQGGDADLLNTIFREVHTLKGSAGFVGLESIQLLAHRLEDVFGAVRDGRVTVTPELIDVAFAGLQMLTSMREDVLGGGAGEMDVAPMVNRLEAALRNPEPAEAQDEALPPTSPAVTQAEPVTAAAPPPSSPAESTLRVAVGTLDTMMELVGELITARNALVTIGERLEDETLNSTTSAISRLTQELQTTVTSVRLVPVERLFTRFTGVVRNMARERGKQVHLVIEGGDTPLDRTISEQMYDPLIHLLRNAVDHGLEPTVDRRRVGKPEESTICLSAERRGDDVMLCVSDDGSGIDPDRVRRVAVERGLCSDEEATALSNEQAIHLIFEPGFSTATTVTDVSGRGVGLDVVMQNVRRLRGTVSVETAIGQGTTFVIQLPLSLAILQVQLVCVGEYTYALPLVYYQ
jgi:two-component system chemotaxis sensor kinase CheA